MKLMGTHSPIRDLSPMPSSKRKSLENRYYRVTNALWLWEFFGWVLSTACLMTIVGLLAHYGGKPLRSWPHSITLNSTLAILSAISKSALMIPVAAGIGQLKWTRLNKQRSLYDLERFDLASRGPLGSTLLIWRGGFLTFVGALVIITSLAFEPFIQQIVSYPSKRIDEGILASIPRSYNYSAYVLEGATAPTPTIADDMKAAIYTGMYTNGSDVTPLCPSGNCTWDVFDSVAVCGTCVDKTDDITLKFPTQKNPIWGSTSGCVVSLSNGLGLASAPVEYWIDTLCNLSIGSATSDLEGRSSSLVNFTSIYYDNGQAANCTQPGGTARATECNVYWCVNTYNSSVSSNKFTESILASRPMLKNVSGSSWDNLAFYYRNNDRTFRIADGVQPPITGFLTGQVFQDGNASLSNEHYNMAYSSDILSLLYNAASPDFSQTSSTPIVLHGRNTKGIAQFIDKLVRTMTTNVRTTSNGEYSGLSGTSGPPVNGIVWEQLTYIHVRWAWLGLPLALDLLAICFLLCVIFQTFLTKTEPWKSSQMVTVFRGLSLRAMMDFDAPGGVAEMNEVARTVKVTLQESERLREGKTLVNVS